MIVVLVILAVLVLIALIFVIRALAVKDTAEKLSPDKPPKAKSKAKKGQER